MARFSGTPLLRNQARLITDPSALPRRHSTLSPSTSRRSCATCTPTRASSSGHPTAPRRRPSRWGNAHPTHFSPSCAACPACGRRLSQLWVVPCLQGQPPRGRKGELRPLPPFDAQTDHARFREPRGGIGDDSALPERNASVRPPAPRPANRGPSGSGTQARAARNLRGAPSASPTR